MGGYLLRQALDDCCFAYAGLADEHRVVLRLAQQGRNDTFYLSIAAANRFKLTAKGSRGQVTCDGVRRTLKKEWQFDVVQRSSLFSLSSLYGTLKLDALAALEVRRIFPKDFKKGFQDRQLTRQARYDGLAQEGAQGCFRAS
jgi:hypothetical protein